MIVRRSIIFVGAIALLAAASSHAPAAPPTGDDPVAIINAIYIKVAKGKGDSGGNFMFDTKAAKAKYLSKPLIELWAKSDARTARATPGLRDSIPSPIRRIPM